MHLWVHHFNTEAGKCGANSKYFDLLLLSLYHNLEEKKNIIFF